MKPLLIDFFQYIGAALFTVGVLMKMVYGWLNYIEYGWVKSVTRENDKQFKSQYLNKYGWIFGILGIVLILISGLIKFKL